MGVLEPVDEAFEEVPATPPGFRDLEMEEGSDDDLFADPKEERPALISYESDLSFRNIFPVLPSKRDFEDFYGVSNMKNILEVQFPQEKKGRYCSRCVDDVNKDLKKLTDVAENYRNERDAVKNENDALKKELEELKKLLKRREDSIKGDVRVTVSNSKEEVDLLLRKKNFEDTRNIFNNNENSKQRFPQKNGVQSFSISLPTTASDAQPTVKKTVAELRREFFAKEFQSEQNTFTSRNFLEIKPEEKKETFRSRLTIRIKPKKKITELISKLTSKISGSKVVPEASPITMFQRFEKTRFVWQSDSEENTAF